MDGHRDRIARRIRKEAAKHGESPGELAHALHVHSSTAERWFRGERTPQVRHRRELAGHWELPLETFEPDLEAEEKELRDRLDSIEDMLKHILAAIDAQPRVRPRYRDSESA